MAHGPFSKSVDLIADLRCSRENVNDTNQVVIVDLADANNLIRRPSELLWSLFQCAFSSLLDSHCGLRHHASKGEDNSAKVWVDGHYQ